MRLAKAKTRRPATRIPNVHLFVRFVISVTSLFRKVIEG